MSFRRGFQEFGVENRLTGRAIGEDYRQNARKNSIRRYGRKDKQEIPDETGNPDLCGPIAKRVVDQSAFSMQCATRARRGAASPPFQPIWPHANWPVPRG